MRTVEMKAQETLNKTYEYQVENNVIRITKEYRTKTQYEWRLQIFMMDRKTESLHLFQQLHLSKKSALNEAKRAISKPPRIERVF